MYGLPKDTDLSFLIGLEVTQVAIGLHHIALSFHEGSSIDLECEFELSGKLISPDPPAKFAKEGGALIKLLGHRVKSAAVEGNGTVRMDFSNEIELRIFDSNSNYESYKVTWSTGQIIV